MIHEFISGAIMFGCAVSAAFFFKAWRRSRDRFFLWFGAAFSFLAAERIVRAIWHTGYEPSQPYVYVLRLVAFAIIIAAIVDKNRGA